MQGYKEIYKGFEIEERRASAMFSDFRSLSARAVLRKSPCRGRNEDVVFEGKIREVKKSIREFWGDKK